ncbi:MAG: UDP-N-acetylmuramoyl-L-alanine--D-glutamate ligase [Parcubacteria group bacterium]|nr:UDP-N-acetylmuramoyl-L-alanine--D-glutamate ligase [Parcubacteria group bacterium]
MNIVVMGLGLYARGSGISAAKFFILRGDNVLITDLKTREELSHQIQELEKFCKVKKRSLPKYSLGGHKEKDFKKIDIVMRNPGVPRDSKFLKAARKNGAKIETDISIFLKNCDAEIIGVTGTRGKSTTATLIHEMLKEGGKGAWLGGNIKVSPLSFIRRIKKDDTVVLELSSWMLENFDELGLAPHIAMVTNIFPDHLNTYKNMKEYISAKKNIFKNQTKDDYLVLNKDNKETRRWKGNGETIYFRRKDVPLCKIKLQGEHNLENIAGAIAVAGIYKIPFSKLKKVLREFKGLPDRQELVAEKNGIKFINDTTATTPDGAIAALKTFGVLRFKAHKYIILIAGGNDKGLDYEDFVKEVKRYCKTVLLLPGTATDKIKKLFQASDIKFQEVKNMRRAIALAKLSATKGDIVLLSPAASSFGLFKNEFERGKRFKRAL